MVALLTSIHLIPVCVIRNTEPVRLNWMVIACRKIREVKAGNDKREAEEKKKHLCYAGEDIKKKQAAC